MFGVCGNENDDNCHTIVVVIAFVSVLVGVSVDGGPSSTLADWWSELQLRMKKVATQVTGASVICGNCANANRRRRAINWRSTSAPIVPHRPSSTDPNLNDNRDNHSGVFGNLLLIFCPIVAIRWLDANKCLLQITIHYCSSYGSLNPTYSAAT